MNKSLITILTAPKPFVDPHIQVIQRNALRSWLALGDMVDIIVLGDDEGIRENMQILGIRHFPDVVCNDKGTPIISSMLKIAKGNSTSPYLAIVNTDIILFDNFIHAVQNIKTVKEKFLIAGQRWDMDIRKELKRKDDFTQLESRVRAEAKLHPPAGSDYFIFPRNCYQSIPDFAIGRAGWDNWYIYKSRFEGWPVIDGTHDVMIVHQDHDYRHLPNGQPHYRLPETKQNVIMGGGEHTIFTLFDAQYSLCDSRIDRKNLSFKKLIREIEIFPLIFLRSLLLGKLFFYIFHPGKGYAAFRTWLRKLRSKL